MFPIIGYSDFRLCIVVRQKQDLTFDHPIQKFKLDVLTTNWSPSSSMQAEIFFILFMIVQAFSKKNCLLNYTRHY